jgi:hypothetical protein
MIFHNINNDATKYRAALSKFFYYDVKVMSKWIHMHSLRLDKIQLIILGALIVYSFSFYAASAQEYNTNMTMQQTKLEGKINELDNLLGTAIPASLTGLSLTGATFLMRVVQGEENDIVKNAILNAKKNLVKAFVLFLACTVAIFVFDFIEIIYHVPFFVLILDLAITYGLFFTGLGYLASAAKEIYATQGK